MPLVQNFKKNRHLRRAYKLVSRSLYFPPLVVLAAILIITIWPWQNARQSLRNNSNSAVQEKATNIQEKLIERFSSYNASLQSGVSLLQANPNLSSDQWRVFFDSLNLNTDRSGLQGTGYTKIFSQDQTSQINNFMVAQGVVDFSVHPTSSANEQNSAVLYLYPQTNNNTSAIGFNMLTEPTRRAAMLRARDTGKPSLTGKVTLLQNVKIDQGRGFLMYVPYFRAGTTNTSIEQRQQNLVGFVYGSFRAGNLFNQVVETPSKHGHYSAKIYDQSIANDNLLYETSNVKELEKLDNTEKIVKSVSIFGATWQFEFTFDKDYLSSRSEKNAPTYILLVGVVTAFLVFLALVMIFKSRAAELQQQKDKEVNLAKDELLSLASHQMRTPATGVKQYLGMVLQGFAGTLTDSQLSLLDKAYTSNERQLHVINQILHLAKLEAGRIVLAKHSTDITELVKDIVEEQQDELNAHGHKLKLKLPKKKIMLYIDSHMIRMAIENILTNAIKYTLESGEIGVTLTQTTTHVRIVIKDSGIGIDPKQYSEIFKQFTRLYDEQTEKVSGTGVGLYLADQLVRLHRGSLLVDSVVNEGSEFIIILPKLKHKKQ